MKVLVTGASGRVGANMVKRLLGAGANVRAMVMPEDPQAVKLKSLTGVEIAEATLTDQAAIDKACQGITHVIHLAAQMVRGNTPVDKFFDINALGTLRLLEGVVRAGGVERFVLTSTDGTYRPGEPPCVPMSEDTPQEPADYYGTSKLISEVILRNHAAQYDIPYAVTRFATVISPEEAPGIFTLKAARDLFRRAERGRDSNIWQLFRGRPNLAQHLDIEAEDAADHTATALVGPEGSPWTIHLVDVRDAVEGVYLALTHPAALGQAFNIAATEPTSRLEGATVVAELLNVPNLTIEMPMTWRLEMTVNKAHDILGYQPKHDYRSMVESSRAATDDYIPARFRS